MLELRRAKNEDYSEIETFYSGVGYSGKLAQSDIVVVARENSEVVGAVRLCLETNCLVLRGMYVSEQRRGTGIGAALLLNASNEIGLRKCWCIPFIHLCSFYGKIGFMEVQPNTAPAFLSARIAEYTDRGKSVVLMRRPEHWSLY